MNAIERQLAEKIVQLYRVNPALARLIEDEINNALREKGVACMLNYLDGESDIT
jgi:hypothetical protein